MKMRDLILAACPILLLAAAPASATGNGNYGHNHHPGDGCDDDEGGGQTPGPISIGMPAVSGRGAYVTQIGSADEARINQTARDAYAEVRQKGDRNEAIVTQTGNGSAYTEVRQTGDRNEGTVVQGGAGRNVLYLTQTGNGNRATGEQSAGASGLHNGAIMTQLGYYNDMALDQAGNDNRAILTQDGVGNDMTATQTGSGNRLVWTQDGNNRPDLNISQTGNQAIQITQRGY